MCVQDQDLKQWAQKVHYPSYATLISKVVRVKNTNVREKNPGKFSFQAAWYTRQTRPQILSFDLSVTTSNELALYSHELM